MLSAHASQNTSAYDFSFVSIDGGTLDLASAVEVSLS